MDLLHHLGRDKRKSLTDHGKTLSTKGPPKLEPHKAARLEVTIESPPLVLYGDTDQSSGALLSGLLKLTVPEPDNVLEAFTMKLIAQVTIRKPVSKDCADCKTQQNEVFRWNFLKGPTHHLVKGTHAFPFSYLLPGHLPATTHNKLADVDYILVATASTSSEVIKTSHDLGLTRALWPPESDRESSRVFPPTTMKAEVIHPVLIHPIGLFGIQVRLTGMQEDKGDHLRRWVLKKVLWSVEEHSTMISPACLKHEHKVGGEGKGIQHTDTTVLGEGTIKKGWKSDYGSDNGGIVELEFPMSIDLQAHPTCDVRDPTGLDITHMLVVEFVIAEEISVSKTGKAMSPTGSARVLRTKFRPVLTNRIGMGISWDEEQPPVYEDVPGSPPTYVKIENYVDEPPEEDLGLHQ